MPEFIKQLSLLCFLMFFLIPPECKSQDNSGKDVFTFMFYNVENYFDCLDDSLTDDDEFTYSGIRGWNQSRLNYKTERIAKTILAAGKWNSPVFVGLCETENREVLELLTNSMTLSKFNYKIIQKDSPDERGIDVSFIYRPDLFRPLNYEAIPIIDSTDLTFKSRDILHVRGTLNGCESIHVFVNHWPSRYGGVMETVRFRKLASETLQKAIRNIKKTEPEAKIICTGDFNDSPQDESMEELVKLKDRDTAGQFVKLINLSADWMSEDIKTLKSQYTWEVFDQWIVSASFLGPNNCYRFLKAEIMKDPFLLEPDTKFGGVKPRRTYIGFKYQNGFSDHLPVLLRIELVNH
jgi:hypothetical protein